jgi:hypothetical protein
LAFPLVFLGLFLLNKTPYYLSKKKKKSIRNVIDKKDLPMNVVSSIHGLHPKSTSSGAISSDAHFLWTVANGPHFK